MGYEVMEGANGQGLIKAWVHGVQVEEVARQQLRNTASMPFIYKWLAVMPDCHWGKGSTIGSVLPTKGAIIPAAVGVDIGCGMCASMTNLSADDLPTNLKDLRHEIERVVPQGRTDNGGPGDWGAWHDLPEHVALVWRDLAEGWEHIIQRHPKLKSKRGGREPNHLGTLGTGNHFLEVCLDQHKRVWVILHSGSRGVGNRIGSYFISLAKEDMRQWYVNLPDVDLAYLPEGTQHFEDYIYAMIWAQNYAMRNRQLMLKAAMGAIDRTVAKPHFTSGIETAVNCHHNYAERENHYGENVWITRKGAVRARKGDFGIIPSAMKGTSYIVVGKGQPESFMSCSHGAGRAMSRREAMRRFTLEDYQRQTEGVECKKDSKYLIEEIPDAYKDIATVMAAQDELVEVVHELNQVLCVKGEE